MHYKLARATLRVVGVFHNKLTNTCEYVLLAAKPRKLTEEIVKSYFCERALITIRHLKFEQRTFNDVTEYSTFCRQRYRRPNFKQQALNPLSFVRIVSESRFERRDGLAPIERSSKLIGSHGWMKRNVATLA